MGPQDEGDEISRASVKALQPNSQEDHVTGRFFFLLGMPFVRAINPVTHNNWEGTGVAPDVKVPAGDVLNALKKLAAEGIDADKAQAPAQK